MAQIKFHKFPTPLLALPDIYSILVTRVSNWQMLKVTLSMQIGTYIALLILTLLKYVPCMYYGDIGTFCTFYNFFKKSHFKVTKWMKVFLHSLVLMKNTLVSTSVSTNGLYLSIWSTQPELESVYQTISPSTSPGPTDQSLNEVEPPFEATFCSATSTAFMWLVPRLWRWPPNAPLCFWPWPAPALPLDCCKNDFYINHVSWA